MKQSSEEEDLEMLKIVETKMRSDDENHCYTGYSTISAFQTSVTTNCILPTFL